MSTKKSSSSKRAMTSRSASTISKKASRDWSVPKGKDVQSITRDATRQVIKHYGDTLDKLKRS